MIDRDKLFEGQILKKRHPELGYWEKVKVIGFADETDGTCVICVQSLRNGAKAIVGLEKLFEVKTK